MKLNSVKIIKILSGYVDNQHFKLLNSLRLVNTNLFDIFLNLTEELAPLIPNENEFQGRAQQFL